MRLATLGFAISLWLVSLCGVASAGPDRATLEAEVRALPRATAIYLTGEGVATPFGVATGSIGLDGTMTVDTPLRIASNTKTFTAAALLRLWETGRLDLDAPIGPLLTPALDALLRADGYDTQAITVREVMSHSAGFYDHGSDSRFVRSIMETPAHQFTREELVSLSMAWADPQSAPGTRFQYSDTGYILLGDIVERLAEKPLGPAVRELLKLDDLGLASTWWEVMEPQPGTAPDRAPQALGDFDATGVHASADLYGGGGLVMSARDLAIFFAALFERRVFDRPETLAEMLRRGPHQRADHYRLGVFVISTADGRDIYWHSGFWGTIVAYDPQAKMAVSGMTTNQDNFLATARVVQHILDTPPLVP